MIDTEDVRVLVKAVVLVGAGSSLVLTVAAVFGLALRIFGLTAG